MIGHVLNSEWERELLSQTIRQTLESWPPLHRQIFSEAHYGGMSIESIGDAHALSLETVRAILQDCEHRLRNALKMFRSGTFSLPLKYATDRCCL